MTYLFNFLFCLGIAAYMCGFIWFFDRAFMVPVEKDPFHPIYSVWWIMGWVLYICAGAAAVLTSVTESEPQ